MVSSVLFRLARFEIARKVAGARSLTVQCSCWIVHKCKCFPLSKYLITMIHHKIEHEYIFIWNKSQTTSDQYLFISVNIRASASAFSEILVLFNIYYTLTKARMIYGCQRPLSLLFTTAHLANYSQCSEDYKCQPYQIREGFKNCPSAN